PSLAINFICDLLISGATISSFILFTAVDTSPKSAPLDTSPSRPLLTVKQAVFQYSKPHLNAIFISIIKINVYPTTCILFPNFHLGMDYIFNLGRLYFLLY